ncbi:MAG TPA: type I methionyl aminopeptidase [Rhodothermales bacterium]|nr:type I methionyl aminopeptidase [Rhodothermales bacterium]
MSIQSKRDFQGLREAGRVVRRMLKAMEAAVHAGVTTAEINAVGAAILVQEGARSAPMLVYGFPAETLISVNDEVVHGIPSDRIIETGDLVKLDVTVEKDGYMADAAVTVAVPPTSEVKLALMACAQHAFTKALAAARSGNRVYEIGRAVEREVKRSGFTVVAGLSGHGIGRSIHEKPSVPNEYDRRARQRLREGLVITIEPMITSGSHIARQTDDGWTVKTADGAPSAHYEHTLVITNGAPILLTAA